MIELEAGDASLTVHPDDGGRLGSLEVAGRALLCDDPALGPMLWGCYPMVPWAGRVRHGRFRFDGMEHRLPVNLPPHAIHGTGFTARWEVTDAGRDYCELRCTLDWPFGGTAHQHVQLHDGGVTCILTAHATGRAMPAVVGWHPCFRKPAAAELAFGGMHVRDEEGMATAELVAPKPHPWDDCFVEPLGPLRLHYAVPTGGELVLTVGSDCDHWVVYDERDDMTCVEPQSGPPDAFTIGGAARLEPGELLQRRMTLRWEHARPPVTPG